jgi:phosphoribosylglycinamide formyltransferase-1
VAERNGIECELMRRRSYARDFDRDGYTAELTGLLNGYDIDLVVMAGFGTILSKGMFETFPGHVLNTHPALLPAFPGAHAVPEALDYGVRVTGCTVHLVDAGVDTGPILAQHAVEVRDGDDEQQLHERIKVVERRLLVDVLAALATRGVVWTGRKATLGMMQP